MLWRLQMNKHEMTLNTIDALKRERMPWRVDRKSNINWIKDSYHATLADAMKSAEAIKFLGWRARIRTISGRLVEV